MHISSVHTCSASPSHFDAAQDSFLRSWAGWRRSTSSTCPATTSTVSQLDSKTPQNVVLTAKITGLKTEHLESAQVAQLSGDGSCEAARAICQKHNTKLMPCQQRCNIESYTTLRRRRGARVLKNSIADDAHSTHHAAGCWPGRVRARLRDSPAP